MNESNNNKQNRWYSIREHIDKWKSVYDLLGHFFVFLAVVAGFIGLLISWNAVKQTKRSIDITNESLIISENALKIQKDEFFIRNRPFILIRDLKYSGPVTMLSGKHYDYTVVFLMSNVTAIPANSIIIEAVNFINDKEIRKTVFGAESLSSDIGILALPPDTHTSGIIGLTQNEFEVCKTPGNRFCVKIEMTYSGILGTPEDKYHTSYTVIYSVEQGTFKMTDSKYN